MASAASGHSINLVYMPLHGHEGFLGLLEIAIGTHSVLLPIDNSYLSHDCIRPGRLLHLMQLVPHPDFMVLLHV